jgi:hypothetical protein
MENSRKKQGKPAFSCCASFTYVKLAVESFTDEIPLNLAVQVLLAQNLLSF